MRLALTKRSGDATRMLVHLAGLPEGTRLTSSSLAKACGVAALEGSLELDRCSIDDRRCVDRPYFCGMHRTWSAVHAGLMENLSNLTLAEAAERERVNASHAHGERGPAPD